jgi:RsiW-degrading membrane proteinase PrsW (M82 family)
MEIVLGILASILVAVVSTLLYVFIIWWLDRHEREPGWLLVVAFLWGAIPAIIASLVAELILDIPLSALGEGLAYNVAGTGFGAPVIEESAKALALLGIFFFYRREFDNVLDGIIYGALVGFGFAMTEDVFYFLSSLLEGGLAAWSLVVFMRVVLFGLNHALFTAMTGAGLGLARLSKSTGIKVVAPIGGLLVAIVLHAIHNLGASLAEATYCLSFLAAFTSDWIGVLVIFIIIVMVGRQERKWIVEELREEVGVALSPEEYELVTSWNRRLALRWGALMSANFRRWRRLGKFLQTATELAFKKYQLRVYGDEDGNRALVDRLRRELIELPRG